jgi:hypothetical protein
MPMYARRRQPAPVWPLSILALAGAWCVLLLGPQPATAANSAACAEAVVVDWSDNGHVDGVYPLSCYQAAIRELPPDVRDYSTASDEINRALAIAVNHPKHGAGAITAAEPAPAVRTTGGSDSVPLALITLGGIAVLVLAAGTTGYVARKTRARHG